MLMLLSPAKTLDFESPLAPSWQQAAPSRPLFMERAAELAALARRLSVAQLAELMELSPALAELNVARFQAWRVEGHDADPARAALLAFDGDVYAGLDARSLDAAAIARAQQRLRILSGLYGLLRPLDRILPYRLEMGRALANPQGRGLYAFWGEQLALELNRLGAEQRVPVLVNLASQEYFKAVARKALRLPVIETVFEEVGADGRAKVISFYAKRARGLMARFALQQDIDHPDGLRAFAAEGYAWKAANSSPERWVFQRKARAA